MKNSQKSKINGKMKTLLENRKKDAEYDGKHGVRNLLCYGIISDIPIVTENGRTLNRRRESVKTTKEKSTEILSNVQKNVIKRFTSNFSSMVTNTLIEHQYTNYARN